MMPRLDDCRFRFRSAIVTWSGGIDSTALLACLVSQSPTITALSFDMPYGPLFNKREADAREALWPTMMRHAVIAGCNLERTHRDASFLPSFENAPGHSDPTAAAGAIPMRNRLMIDYLCARWPQRYCIGMGEYVGADSWVTKDHVTGLDCDSRALTAYLFENYGLSKQLVTLDHFGPCRFKDQRLKIGLDVIEDAMMLTTNCLNDNELHCGECYKCCERAAAFEAACDTDATKYATMPDRAMVERYKAQFSQGIE